MERLENRRKIKVTEESPIRYGDMQLYILCSRGTVAVGM
jgi:hypothetical protein